MAGRLTNAPRTNCRYRFGGSISKTRDVAGIKAPRNGVSPKVMDMAKGNGRAEGITGDDGIGADGIPVKTSLARPGRKFGGRTGTGLRPGIPWSGGKDMPHKGESEADKEMKDDKAEYAKGGRTPNFHPGGEKGKLHRELGISEDKKIPAKRLAKAEHSKDPEIKRDAVRAETMKHWHKK